MRLREVSKNDPQVAQGTMHKLSEKCLACLALWKHHKLNKYIVFTMQTYHKAKQVYCIHHANIQETYYRKILRRVLFM